MACPLFYGKQLWTRENVFCSVGLTRFWFCCDLSMVLTERHKKNGHRGVGELLKSLVRKMTVVIEGLLDRCLQGRNFCFCFFFSDDLCFCFFPFLFDSMKGLGFIKYNGIILLLGIH